MPLILASSSPRRQQLLQQIGIIPHQIISPNVDESIRHQERAKAYVERIAKAKVEAVKAEGEYVLSADTAVEVGRTILTKAENRETAAQMLTQLSRRRHRVYTAVCVKAPSGKISYRTAVTILQFKRLSLDEIESYLDSNEWQGVAGGYMIQGLAGKFVKFLRGSYTNVVGLPLYEADSLLRGLGFRG